MAGSIHPTVLRVASSTKRMVIDTEYEVQSIGTRRPPHELVEDDERVSREATDMTAKR